MAVDSFCFLALGDYPTQHGELRHLLSGHPQRNRNDAYPFDWLRRFAQPPEELVGQHQPVRDHVQLIGAYLDKVQVSDSRLRLSSLARLLTSASLLRNDSNYEALLIAHEYRHRIMSGAFDRL